jgi:hypothetical protein
MITGFNTDVDSQGRVFHVQTEDKGLDNPVVESLVYCGGEIIESRRHSYADLAEAGECSEDEILMRMEAQHQGLIREIRNGIFDTEEPRPFGHDLVTNRSLDEVVLDFLQKEEDLGPLALELLHDHVLHQGSLPELAMVVTERASGRPIAGAEVKLTLISTRDKPTELYAGVSDDDGRIDAAFALPEVPDADLAVLIRASAAGRRTVLRRDVHVPERAPDDGSGQPQGHSGTRPGVAGDH